jgi:hypothetical protein
MRGVCRKVGFCGKATLSTANGDRHPLESQKGLGGGFDPGGISSSRSHRELLKMSLPDQLDEEEAVPGGHADFDERN